MNALASQITSDSIVLFMRLLRRRSKKTSKLRATGLLVLVREIQRWIHHTKGQWRDDVIMMA